MPINTVLLVTPPYHCGMVESAGVWMPLGLAYLAGAVRQAGYEPEIYDAMSLGHDLARIEQEIAGRRPDVVAVTAYTATINAALGVLRAARAAAPTALTVIGGVHPTYLAAEVLAESAVDYVVRGEGEASLVELLACIDAGEDGAQVAGVSCRRAGQVVSAPDRRLLGNLDRLPVAWDLVDWPLYHYRTKPGSRLAIVSWARGCPHRCTFCSQHKLWRGTWRARQPAAVVDELRFLREEYGVDVVEVADELPTADRARWEQILDRLIEANLGLDLLIETRADDIVRDADLVDKYAAAGIMHVYVGVESAYQDRLDAMNKGLRVDDGRHAVKLLNDAGIITETSFLLGFPGDTPQAVEDTLARAIEYGPDLAFFLPVTPWPYSDLYAAVADRVEETDYSRYNLVNPIIKPDGITRQELAGLLRAAFARFYSHRLGNLGALPSHKQAYLRQVSRLLVEESYLSAEVTASLQTHAGVGGG